MASTGCTPQQAWHEWDLPSIDAQLNYWRRHPPVHLLVAAYLDFKPPADGSLASNASNDASAEALMAMVPVSPTHLASRIPNPYSRKPPHGGQ